MSHSSFKNSPQKIDRILVVDDSPDNCFLIQTILQEEGYEVEIAESGIVALEIIDRQPPDLLLLDVMMPGMDGYEVTRRVRDNEKLPFMPIALITAFDPNQASVARGLDIGADEFIRKPVEVDELMARVRSLLRLKHSVDERDQIAQQRENFVSWMTHDLRTPLVAADRMLTLFQQGALGEMSPAMREAVVTMARSNQTLLTMVNTLLEVYRFEAGRKNLIFAPMSLADLIQEVIPELKPLTNEKGLELTFTLVPDPSHPNLEVGKVVGDRMELRRLVTNLLGNAIKFTDTGSVNLRLSSAKAPKTAEPEQQSIPWVKLEVQDTGPGIPAENLTAIFERFRQGSHNRQGSGLGLHLSRRIVEVHKGTIHVESNPGEGSTFVVYLPTER